jgi:hypothetical protein
MDTPKPAPVQPLPIAWQPFTFGGVAAFARVSTGRTLLVAALMAAVIAVISGRFLWTAWYPVIEVAIGRLPATGAISEGRLAWPTNHLLVLGDNAFLSLVVNPAPLARAGQSADLQFELRPDSLECSSLAGYVSCPYPEGLRIPLNRPEIEPLWGAWGPYVRLGLPLLASLTLLVLWIAMAALLVLPIRLYASLAGRRVTLAGSGRLAVMAFMPGAALMCVAMALYTDHRLTLVELLAVNGVHLVVGLAYLALAPLRLPRAGLPEPGTSSDAPRTPRPPALPTRRHPESTPNPPAPETSTAAPQPPMPKADHDAPA